MQNVDKKQTNEIIRSPHTNIPENMWEYKITKIDKQANK